MISKRIKYIASFIDNDDKVLDIGTDHALLPIYLYKNNVTKNVDGSDISSKVLLKAKDNLEEYRLSDIINLYLSDGTKSINTNNYNTFVITGMGFHTIKDILDNSNLDTINKMIIQSNNNVEDLRKYLNSINYKIVNDKYIKDKNKEYSIISAIKGNQSLSDIEYVCGLYDKDNVWYYDFIVKKYQNILSNIPGKHDKKIEQTILYYKDYLSTEKIEEKRN